MIQVKCRLCGTVFEVPASVKYDRCPECGEYVKVPRPGRPRLPRTAPASRGMNTLQVLGLLDCAFSSAVLIYFACFLDVGVRVSDELTVANFELMNWRTIGIIVAAAADITGAIMLSIGWAVARREAQERAGASARGQAHTATGQPLEESEPPQTGGEG